MSEIISINVAIFWFLFECVVLAFKAALGVLLIGGISLAFGIFVGKFIAVGTRADERAAEIIERERQRRET